MRLCNNFPELLPSACMIRHETKLVRRIIHITLTRPQRSFTCIKLSDKTNQNRRNISSVLFRILIQFQIQKFSKHVD